MKEISLDMLRLLAAKYEPGQVLAEGRISYDLKQAYGRDCCTKEQFLEALKELAQERFLERMPVLPDWRILRLPNPEVTGASSE